MIEGTHVGAFEIEPGVETEWSTFEPLYFSLERLEANGRFYKLLTTANESRPNCPMPGLRCFEAESYPATITGSQVGSSSFGTESGSIECATGSYSGSLGEGSESLEVSPSYGTCDVFGLPFAAVDINECKYKFAATSKVEEDKYKGTVDISCPGGKSLAFTSGCHCTVTIGSQTALATIEYVDTTSASPSKDIDIKATVSGLKYTEGSSCSHPGTRSNGTYSGEITVKADAEGSPQGIWLSG